MEKKRTRIAKGPLPVTDTHRKAELWKSFRCIESENFFPDPRWFLWVTWSCRLTDWCINERKCFSPKRWKI